MHKFCIFPNTSISIFVTIYICAIIIFPFIYLDQEIITILDKFTLDLKRTKYSLSNIERLISNNVLVYYFSSDINISIIFNYIFEVRVKLFEIFMRNLALFQFTEKYFKVKYSLSLNY